MPNSPVRLRFVLLTILLGFAATPAAWAENETKRPNILFILADDQSPFDLKIYNERSTLNTPNIDRLARQGMVLDGAHHMGAFVGAVCTPSRHMIMSGRTVWHLPNRRNRKNNPNATNPQRVPPSLAENTLAAVFNRAGYDTMRTCKRGNSYEAANQLFTVRHDATKRGGTDETGSAWHAERVLDFLGEREKTKDEDPFLVYFGLSHPHDVRDGKPELLANYGAVNHRDRSALPKLNPKQPPLPVNYLPAHPFPNSHMAVRDEVAVSGVWKNRDEATIRNEIGRQYACVENIDIQIGRVLKKLEAMGELENTYVIYTADHGMAIGRHGLQGKQNLYEHTFRVPMIVMGPGVQSNSRAKGNVYLLDLLATFCDLAGIDAPTTNEGLSFKRVLQGKEQSVRDTLFGVYCGGQKPGMRCVKQGEWKLIKYESPQENGRHTQLFHLAKNPHEYLQQHHAPKVAGMLPEPPKNGQVNLATDPKFKPQLEKMEAMLLAEMRRLHDPFRFWNQPKDGLPAPKAEAPAKKKQSKRKKSR